MRHATLLTYVAIAVTFGFLLSARSSLASVPVDKMNMEMENILSPLAKVDGWNAFVKAHPDCFGGVDEKNPINVGVSDVTVKIDNSDYKVGLGCRSFYAEAKPKSVVAVANNPHLFQALYGLDKPADIFPVTDPDKYKARVFKLVPGIETQDYTLDYSGHWDGDVWIQHARLDKDERNFALRDNMKLVEPKGPGTVFRELSLFVPMRWWMNLVHGVVQSVTKRELTKLNVAMKCAAELVEKGATLDDKSAHTCHLEAEK